VALVATGAVMMMTAYFLSFSRYTWNNLDACERAIAPFGTFFFLFQLHVDEHQRTA
jgi:hypothetical protein